MRLPAVKSPLYVGLMTGVLLLVAALTFGHLQRDALWLDEVLTYFMAGGAHNGPLSPLEVASRVMADAAWPPGYYLALAVWGRFTGWSELAVRLLSLLAGMITVALVYRLGKSLADARTGLFAAALIGTTAFFLHYFHDARGYTLYMLFTAGAAWAYWRLIHPSRPLRGMQALLVTSSIGLLYTHYIAGMTLAAIAVYHWLFARRKYHFGRIWFLLFLAGDTFLFWIPFMLRAVAREEAAVRSAIDIFGDMARGFANGLPLLLAVMTGLALTAFLPVSLPGIKGTKNTPPLIFCLVWFAVALIAALLANIWLDYLFHLRHIIGLLLPLLLVAAMGLARLSRAYPATALLVLALWMGSGLWLNRTPDFMNSMTGQVSALSLSAVRAVQTILLTQAAPQDAIVLYLTDPEDEWFLEEVFKHYLYGIPQRYAQPHNMAYPFSWTLTQPYAERVAAFSEDVPRVWLIRLAGLPDTPVLTTFEDILSEMYLPCEEHATPELTVIQYRPKTPGCAAP